jgi:hypothetical protein
LVTAELVTVAPPDTRRAATDSGGTDSRERIGRATGGVTGSGVRAGCWCGGGAGASPGRDHPTRWQPPVVG